MPQSSPESQLRPSATRPSPEPKGGLFQLLPKHRQHRGLTFIEIVATMVVTVILGVICTGGFLMSQRLASATRIRNQARIILQRNIDIALSIPFSSTSTPPVLAISANRAAYDEPGSPTREPKDPKVGQVSLMTKPDGTPFLTGTLWRTVTALNSPNPAGAVIRKVTFTITYEYLGEPQELSLTTLRAQDDQ